MQDIQADLNQNDLMLVFSYFDVNGNGKISYEEFLRVIRGTMNDRRKRIVIMAFEKMDKNKKGSKNVERAGRGGFPMLSYS